MEITATGKSLPIHPTIWAVADAWRRCCCSILVTDILSHCCCCCCCCWCCPARRQQQCGRSKKKPLDFLPRMRVFEDGEERERVLCQILNSALPPAQPGHGNRISPPARTHDARNLTTTAYTWCSRGRGAGVGMSQQGKSFIHSFPSFSSFPRGAYIFLRAWKGSLEADFLELDDKWRRGRGQCVVLNVSPGTSHRAHRPAGRPGLKNGKFHGQQGQAKVGVFFSSGCRRRLSPTKTRATSRRRGKKRDSTVRNSTHPPLARSLQSSASVLTAIDRAP